MEIQSHIQRMFEEAPRPEPWSTPLGNIPWGDPAFSQRMLREHLTQTHQGASRSLVTIERQVDWMQAEFLPDAPSKVLDLGCGPGLYTQRFARHGHACVGIDIAPASIDYARDQARQYGLDCRYQLGDIRTVDLPTHLHLVHFGYGEISVFPQSDLSALLERAAAALRPGGTLVLEPHAHAGVTAIQNEPGRFEFLDEGLFLGRPHWLWTESAYDPKRQIGVRRYLVCEGVGHPVEVHSVWYQSYPDDSWRALLAHAGFDRRSIRFAPNLADTHDPPHLKFVIARRP